MRSKPFYWMGALALITLVLYSCQKDEVTDPFTNNPTVSENPTETYDEPEMTIVVGETPNDGTVTGLPIGVKEAKEVMKVKAILKDIFKETFMQLIINHDFNPAFPALNLREPCSCPGGPGGATITDCGCPAQAASASTGSYPQTITLVYCQTDCSDCTLSNGQTVSGNIDITFTASFSDPNGHTITIVPQSNFMIDGYSVTATDIILMGPPGPAINPASTSASGFNENFYMIQSINGLTVTDPSGGVTTVDNPGFLTGGSILTIADVGDNHGSINNAFGLLDDMFFITIAESDALTVHCSNGETVQEYTSQPIVYDMACSCIQDGTVVMTDENAAGEQVPIMTYYYGYDGTIDVTTGDPVTCPAACPGACDDAILLQTHCATFHDPNSATTRTTCGYESISCP